MSKDDITATGQQYSSSTPYKLKAFQYLMSYHARVCRLIINKQVQPYIYIDLNCGAGYQPDYKKFGDEVFGSPIVALRELNSQNIEPICHFCDRSEESLTLLQKTIKDLKLRCTPHYWAGDNKDSLVQLPSQMETAGCLGLVYSDPNGKQDFPVREIKNLFQLPSMRKVDLLMNVATTYVKRWESNPKVNWDAYSLEEIITGHGKDYIFVRRPENSSLKWTFVYATNWPKQKELKKIHLYDAEKDVGKRILDHLFEPKANPMPGIYNDGSVSIQGSFDFESLNQDANEENNSDL